MKALKTILILVCCAPIFLHGNSPVALTCNGSINVSLDETCSAEVTADMMLEGTYSDIDNFIVSFTSTGQSPVILDGSMIGQTISVTVTDPSDGNSCWGWVLVEDKLAPAPICQDVTVHCFTSTAPEDLPYPIANDNCDDYLDTLYTDIVVDLACSDPQFIQIINRNWSFTDDGGNTGTCTQQIFVRKGTISSVNFPPNYDDIDEPTLPCDGSGWDDNNNGYPDPDETGEPGGNNCSNIITTFDDTVVPICESSFKVIREWTINDWCTSQIINHFQVIKVVGDGPTVTAGPDVTISTEVWGCTGTYNVPTPDISYSCTVNGAYHTSYSVHVNQGTVTNVGNYYVISDLPEGVHEVTILVVDGCGFTETDVFTITVDDTVHPTVICDEHTVVSLIPGSVDPNTGTAKIYSHTFDDGSFDNCGPVYFKSRRMDIGGCDGANGDDFPAIPGYQESFDDYTFFCCDDETVMVIFRVYDVDPGPGPVEESRHEQNGDLFGHYNECMVEVIVQDKIAPIIDCPSDLTFDCAYDLSDELVDPYSSILGVPTISDNCNFDLSVFVEDNTQCGKSKADPNNPGQYLYAYKRTFTATDEFGSSSCVQLIYVIDSDPFNEDDINWPADIEVGCMESVEPEDTGIPTFNQEACSNIAISYDDLLFQYVDGVCAKILREWNVIDWCQFNPDYPSLGGIWTNTQVIKVIDEEAPEVSCPDTIMSSITLDLSNLVVNGDFNQGLAGFTSDYILGTGGAFGILSNEGTFTVATNASNTHTNFSPCDDHTGGGSMLVINGSGDTDQNIWCQTVDVVADRTYSFSCWMTAVFIEAPPIFQFSVNDDIIGNMFEVTDTQCDWQNFSSEWNSGNNTQATICIVNENTALSGNDFAIDDISFRQVGSNECNINPDNPCEGLLELEIPFVVDDCAEYEELITFDTIVNITFDTIINITFDTTIATFRICDSIDFEILPNGDTPTELLEISDQYLASKGVSFMLEDGSSPHIAEVGGYEPVAFSSGFGNGNDSPDPTEPVGRFFLTDDGLWIADGTPPLIIEWGGLSDTVSFSLMDIDGDEFFIMETFDEAGIMLSTDTIRSFDPDTGDGVLTEWGVQSNLENIKSLKITGDRMDGAAFGLGMDNLYWCATDTDIEITSDTSFTFLSDTTYTFLSDTTILVVGDFMYMYDIDYFCDGIIDHSGMDAPTVIYHPFGTHKINWAVKDACGNITECSSIFIVKDCKQPTPVCINGLSTVVMPNVGEVTIWANDFNASSFDNCTAQEDLLYSFSADVNDTGMTFTCENLGINTVQIWVTDESGNADYCTTTIFIGDNEGVCDSVPQPFMVQVRDELERPLSHAFVHNDEYGNISEFMTDHVGYAFFESMADEHTISAYKNDDVLKGVSTYDIVAIQKHLLGIGAFTSPYQFIAADINSSESVTAIDIVELRKVILGANAAFPNNDSWRFIDKSQSITDPSNPWPLHEEVVINAQNSNDFIEFTAIKIGDLNNSAMNAQEPSLEDRASNQFILNNPYIEKGEVIEIPVYASTNEKIHGFQGSVALTHAQLLNIKSGQMEIASAHYKEIGNGHYNFSWNSALAKTYKKDEALFYLVVSASTNAYFEDLFSISDIGLEAEIYTATNDQASLAFTFNNSNQNSASLENVLFQNEPNPFASETLIKFSLAEDGVTDISVFDAMGKEVYHQKMDAKKGMNEFKLSKESLLQTGVYFYKIDSNDFSAVKKMSFIK